MIIMDKTEGNGRFALGTSVIDFFGKVNGLPGGEGVQMGIAVLPAGMSTDFSAHTGDEYSFVVSGSLTCHTHNETHIIPTGAGIFTPAGEMHRSTNDADVDCVCVWFEVDTGIKTQE